MFCLSARSPYLFCLFLYRVYLAWYIIGVRGDINNNSDNVYVANGPQKSKNHRDVLNTSEGGCNSKLNVNAKEFSLERSKTAPKSIMNGTKSEWVFNDLKTTNSHFPLNLQFGYSVVHTQGVTRLEPSPKFDLRYCKPNFGERSEPPRKKF